MRPLCLKTRTSVLPCVPLLFGGLSDTIRCLHLVQYWALPTDLHRGCPVFALRHREQCALTLANILLSSFCARLTALPLLAVLAGLSSHHGCIGGVEKAHREL